MPPLQDWLDRVLSVDESSQDAPPHLTPLERPGVVARLRTEFDLHALDVAGPTIAFDPNAAVQAATTLAHACWFLVAAEGEPPVFASAAASPAANLSADVTLRFLPAVHRRARVRAPGGPLVVALDRILRAWPLSGVLADLDGEPTVAPDFGHPGLELLYAERLAVTRRAGWVPAAGRAREWAERVFAERGVPIPAPTPKEEMGG